MGQLDSLRLARVQNDSWILWLALAGDCVVIFRLNACPCKRHMELVLGKHWFLGDWVLTFRP